MTPRILIVRLSAIGDCIHAVPVLCALREHLPDAFLGWLVEGRSGDLLRGHPALDELIVVPRGWLKSAGIAWRVRNELRRLRFDMTIDVQSLARSALAARLSGAKRRIGYGGVDGRELSPWLNNERVVATRTHIVERNLELLRPLGIETTQASFNLPETPADAALAEETIQALGLRAGFAVINPGAGWPSKLWPRDRFAAVARHVGQSRGLPSLIVWAGDQERIWAEEIVAAAAGHAVLAPATTLTHLAAIARRARLFVASDTGPLHLAAAVGTPCIGLYGPVPAARNGPYGSRHIAIQNLLTPRDDPRRRTDNRKAMLAITVDDVCHACDQILGRRQQAA